MITEAESETIKLYKQIVNFKQNYLKKKENNQKFLTEE